MVNYQYYGLGKLLPQKFGDLRTHPHTNPLGVGEKGYVGKDVRVNQSGPDILKGVYYPAPPL